MFFFPLAHFGEFWTRISDAYIRLIQCSLLPASYTGQLNQINRSTE